MKLIQYVTVILMAQTVQANRIGQRLSESNNTRTDEQSNEQRGISAGDSDHYVTRNNRTVSYVETEDSLSTNIDSMTSSEIVLRSVSSPKFDSAPLTRLKRGRSPRKKKCDPTKPAELCRKGKKKSARKHRKGKRKRCKRKGKGRKKGCGKTPKVTPKPPPVTLALPTPGREKCIRSLECPIGHCCARHHNVKICKPMKKLNDICARPRRKERRNVDRFATCECEVGLVCKRTEGSRLYTCQRTT